MSHRAPRSGITSDGQLPIVLPGEPDLSAVALDVTGRAWAASRGRLWLQQPEAPEKWACVWQDQTWEAPFVSVFANLGIVLAITADGGIIEGRAEGGGTMVSPG